MSKKNQNFEEMSIDKSALRKRAEEQARNMESFSLSTQTPKEIQQMLHELHVHQIELEMQNEELRKAQNQIEAERARYFDLYDLAPVGYCTLSEKGLILEANLTAANLLDVARSDLNKQPISRFIFKDDQDIYYLHRKQHFKVSESQECELRMIKKDNDPFWAHLTINTGQAQDGEPVSRIAFTDITSRKAAEREKAHQKALLEAI